MRKRESGTRGWKRNAHERELNSSRVLEARPKSNGFCPFDIGSGGAGGGAHGRPYRWSFFPVRSIRNVRGLVQVLNKRDKGKIRLPTTAAVPHKNAVSEKRSNKNDEK